MFVNKVKKVIASIREDYELYKNVKPCIDACDDKLSKKIVWTRLNYYSTFLSKLKVHFACVHSPDYRFHRKINKLFNPIYIIDELESLSGKTIVVFGKGDDYNYTKSLLKRSDWRNNFRCIGNSLKKIETITENEVLIIAYSYKGGKIYEYIQTNFPNIQIYKTNSLLWAITRNQYFDVFSPMEEEYIIDCGAFDGKTEELFSNWGGGHIKKIYAFELDPINREKCLSLYESKGLKSIVEFVNKGTSNRNEIIYLDEGLLGSCASRIGSGSIKAEIVKLDDEIKGKVTFIKMDIEGAELDALMGARHIITLQKPRMAICLYHKQSDIYEIPSFLLSIVPEYRFIIRHYSSNSLETVLYAYVPANCK